AAGPGPMPRNPGMAGAGRRHDFNARCRHGAFADHDGNLSESGLRARERRNSKQRRNCSSHPTPHESLQSLHRFSPKGCDFLTTFRVEHVASIVTNNGGFVAKSGRGERSTVLADHLTSAAGHFTSAAALAATADGVW